MPGIGRLPGCDAQPFPTAFGARIGTANVGGDAAEDLIAGSGPDPAADATVRPYRHTGYALLQPGAFRAFPPSAYGVNVEGGRLLP